MVKFRVTFEAQDIKAKNEEEAELKAVEMVGNGDVRIFVDEKCKGD